MEELQKVLTAQYKDPDLVLNEMKRSPVWQRTTWAFYRIANERPDAP